MPKPENLEGGTVQERLEGILREVRNISPGIIGSSVISIEGFTLASLIPAGEFDEGLLAARATAFLTTGEQIAQDLLNETPEQAIVRTEDKYIIFNAITSTAVLVVLADETAAKWGMVIYWLKERILPKLKPIMAKK